MDLYMMQHGQALAEEEDPERPLSEAGIARVKVSAEAIRNLGILPDLLVSSTKRRAIQTARLVADGIGCPADRIASSDSFLPMATVDEALAFLRPHIDKAVVYVVGHMPSLPRLASFLLGGGGAVRVFVQFDNAGLCCVEVDELGPGKGEMKCCLTPDQLRRIAAVPPSA